MSFITNRANFPRVSPEESSLPASHPDNNEAWMSGAGSSTNQYSSPPLQPQPSGDDPLAAALIGVADMATKLFVTHPCTVLRRQCQVHQFARSLHLTPLTMVPVICNMVSKEGVLTLWKGSIGSCVVWGLSNVTEIVISDLFGLPRTVVPNGSREKYWRHLFLKAATFFTMTPFLISSFTETVRSESGLCSEDNKVTDVLTKGIDRLRFAVFGARDASRRFSVLQLAIPTVAFSTAHYVLERALYRQFFLMAKRYVARKDECARSKFHQYVPLIFANMTSSVLADLVLFPIETVLHRMYIQGTRTLIDNMDTGLSAVSITVKYSGFFDCLRSIVEREGVWALYSGVGALGLQYVLHSLLHQLVRACFDRGSEMLRKATANHPLPLATPPLSSNPSFNGGASSAASFSNSVPAPPSLPFPSQLSPMNSPRKVMPSVRSPPRDPTQFPTFGESVAQLDSAPLGSAPFGSLPAFPANRTNVFGSPPARDHLIASPLPPLALNTDKLGDPFSG